MKRTFIVLLVLFTLSAGTFAQTFEDYLNQLKAGTDSSDLSQAKKDQLKGQLDSLKQLMADPETPPSIWWKALDVYICLFRYAESYEKGTPPEQTNADTEFAEDIKANGFLRAITNEHNPFPTKRKFTPPPPPKGECRAEIIFNDSSGFRFQNSRRGVVVDHNVTIHFNLFGDPRGGSFSWELDPDPELLEVEPNAELASDIVFLAKKSGTHRLTGTYFAPNGATCKDFVELFVLE